MPMPDPNQKQRVKLGKQIQDRRESRFGTRRAAYRAAHLNQATWNRAEVGLPVRTDILRVIVRTLWPDTDGDWRRIPKDGADDGPDPTEGLDPEVLRVIRATVREVLAEQQRSR